MYVCTHLRVHLSARCIPNIVVSSSPSFIWTHTHLHIYKNTRAFPELCTNSWAQYLLPQSLPAALSAAVCFVAIKKLFTLRAYVATFHVFAFLQVHTCIHMYINICIDAYLHTGKMVRANIIFAGIRIFIYTLQGWFSQIRAGT